VQFTTDEEYVNLVERAKALLSHAAPTTSIAELHLRAMRALVAALEKRKYAVNSAPDASVVVCEKANGSQPAPNEDEPVARTNPTSASDNPRQRGRSVPAAIKRSVFARDGARCSTFDPTTGQRCRGTRHLELHHETAYARGGMHSASNLTLRCTAHNALAAEVDFGRDFIARRKDDLQHEPYSKQSTCSTA
jgi:5-methylcytosine-specific restriction endonuclease McrA